MPTSTLTFEEGEGIDLGSHGEHDFVFEEGTEVPDTGLSNLVFESGTGLGGLEVRIWYCAGSSNSNGRYELAESDFSTVQSEFGLGTPDGIGGKANVVWYNDTDNNLVYELDEADLSAIRSAGSPDTEPDGIGGTENVIWHGAGEQNNIHELSTSDLSSVRNASLAGSSNFGEVGGDGNVIWFSGYISDDSQGVAEYAPSDLSLVRETGTSTGGNGVGGTSEYIYRSTETGGEERDPTDFSVVRTGSTPDSGDQTGMGA